MATTTPLEDVKTALKMMTFEAVVMILKAPAAVVVHFVTVTSLTAFELWGALEEVAPILAIGGLMLTQMMVRSASLKARCLV